MLPVVINEVEIEIQQLDTADTYTDPVFREPVSKKSYADTILLIGQVNFWNKQFYERQITRSGDNEPSYGHLLFRDQDLADAGVTLQKGDRIRKIAGKDVDFIVKEVRFESPLDGEFLLTYVLFGQNIEERGGVE